MATVCSRNQSLVSVSTSPSRCRRDGWLTTGVAYPFRNKPANVENTGEASQDQKRQILAHCFLHLSKDIPVAKKIKDTPRVARAHLILNPPGMNFSTGTKTSTRTAASRKTLQSSQICLESDFCFRSLVCRFAWRALASISDHFKCKVPIAIQAPPLE